jgi:hypothetical protein
MRIKKSFATLSGQILSCKSKLLQILSTKDVLEWWELLSSPIPSETLATGTEAIRHARRRGVSSLIIYFLK